MSNILKIRGHTGLVLRWLALHCGRTVVAVSMECQRALQRCIAMSKRAACIHNHGVGAVNLDLVEGTGPDQATASVLRKVMPLTKSDCLVVVLVVVQVEVALRHAMVLRGN